MWIAASPSGTLVSLARSRVWRVVAHHRRSTTLSPPLLPSPSPRRPGGQTFAQSRQEGGCPIKFQSAPVSKSLSWSSVPAPSLHHARFTLRLTRQRLPGAPEAGALHRAHMATSAQGGGADGGRLQREILVQHILVKEGEGDVVEGILKKVTQEGESMEALAEKHSLCPSRQKGGLLGWISRGQTVPGFEAAAFGAQLGEVVTATTQFGTHVIRVLEERRIAPVMQIPVEDFEVVRQAAATQGPPQLHPDDDADPSRAQFVDVREPQEIVTAAIKGFEAFPLSEFGEWAPSIKDRLSLEAPTYVLCHHGVRSQQMAEWLVSQGFKEVYNIVGGIDAYSMLVDQSVPRY